MRSLLIVPSYPFPATKGGTQRSACFANELGRYGPVDLVYYYPWDDIIELHPAVKNIYYFPKAKCDVEGGLCNLPLAKKVRRLLNFRPWNLDEYTVSTGQSLLRMILHEKYDVVVCRYINSAWGLWSLPSSVRSRVVVDVDDIVSVSLHAALHGRERGMKALKNVVDLYFLKHHEERCRKYGATFVCSEQDKVHLQQRGVFNVHVVGNTLPPHALNPVETEGYPRRHSLLFVGVLNYQPNIEGIRWFVNTVYEPLKREEPDLTLTIAGRDPVQSVRELEAYNGVRVLADVPDLRLVYEECGVVIVPLFSGGGTRIKILEAGGLGRPVISTPLGAFGLGCKHHKEILEFDSAASFRTAWYSLADENLYQALVRNLSAHILTHFSPETFRKQFEACPVIAKAINKGLHLDTGKCDHSHIQS
ncbi:glycosyltransferase [Oleidesulfovibrio sp.]|uniref:glycosyltransferase n=1 Tax=Oleidesulfovibrio sp. TaxID=2909707 RepID=UPI003A87135D